MHGLGMEGQAVELATVPHAFLREVPLVDGQWIDAYAVALAEWGARLVQKRYALEEPRDGHPFTWYQILDQEGREVAIAVREKLWAQTKKHLAGFPSASREIEGRQYLNWADNLKWRGRRFKGNVGTSLRQGLVLYQWNRWVEMEGRDGVAILDAVKVGRLDCHANGYGYQVVDEQAEALRRREKLLDSLDSEQTGNREDLRLLSKAGQWKEMAEDCLGEFYVLQASFDSINQRYFDGQPGLFPRSAHALSQLAEYAEKLVNAYDRDLGAYLELMESTTDESDAERPRNQHTIDLSRLRRRAQGTATDQGTYLVDMAEPEVLDAMGETEKAIHLVDRHV